ncbi:MAG: TolC family protein [Vicinamibacterales bacterium]
MTGQRSMGMTEGLRAACALGMLTAWLAMPVEAGQPAAAPASPLSLEDAVKWALAHESGLRAERTETDVAQGNVAQAALRPNPMVSLGRQQQPGGMDNQTSLTVEWPLDLFRVAGRVAVAEGEAEATRFRVADRQRLLVADVRAAYGAAAAAQRELDVLTELVTTAAGELEVIRSRVDAGAAPALDRDRLLVERRRLDADRLLQDARANSATLALQRLLGLDPTVAVTLRESLESLVDPASAPPPATGGLADHRPDVQAAWAGVRTADATLDRARRDGRFDVSLFGTYTRMQAAFPQLGYGPGGGLQPIGDTFHYLAAGATVTVPWRNDNRGEIAAATAQRRGAEARYAEAALQARTEIAAATTLDTQARAAVALYAAEIRPLARQNLDVVRQTYRLGRGTVADVLGEQRRYLDIERAYTEALKHAYDARTSLLSALGVQP